jgi:glycosyltransferase involved in cell wall biosynthesis
MAGFLPNHQVMEIIARSKALILPTQWYEGFPMALLESFACGTPVLGSNIGNTGSIIREGINGWHFQYDSPDDMVRAVHEMSDLTDSTKAYLDQYFSAESNYCALMKIYQQCLREK